MSNFMKFADCFTASITRARHLENFPVMSSAAERNTERSLTIGIIPAAPSSTHWRTISSNTLPLGRHCARYTRVPLPQTSTRETTSTEHALCEASAIRHLKTVPDKSNTSTASPERARSEPHKWRLSSADRAILQPACGSCPDSEKLWYALNPAM